MIIEIPFYYSARVTMPRCRNPIHVTVCGARVPVRVPVRID